MNRLTIDQYERLANYYIRLYLWPGLTSKQRTALAPIYHRVVMWTPQ